jgi:hypothetical protein
MDFVRFVQVWGMRIPRVALALPIAAGLVGLLPVAAHADPAPVNANANATLFQGSLAHIKVVVTGLEPIEQLLQGLLNALGLG